MPDPNYIPFLKDAVAGKLIDGQWAFYKNGRFVAQGSQEEMNKLFCQTNEKKERKSLLDLFKKQKNQPFVPTSLTHIDLKQIDRNYPSMKAVERVERELETGIHEYEEIAI